MGGSLLHREGNRGRGWLQVAGACYNPMLLWGRIRLKHIFVCCNFCQKEFLFSVAVSAKKPHFIVYLCAFSVKGCHLLQSPCSEKQQRLHFQIFQLQVVWALPFDAKVSSRCLRCLPRSFWNSGQSAGKVNRGGLDTAKERRADLLFVTLPLFSFFLSQKRSQNQIQY